MPLRTFAFVLLLGLTAWATPGAAQETGEADAPKAENSASPSSTPDSSETEAGDSDAADAEFAGIPAAAMQPADDAVEVLDPVVSRDEATKLRLDAVAHFMAGQLHERRREPAEALTEYREALRLNPDAYDVYPSFVPMAFLLGQGDEAVVAARAAATRFDQGHDLLRGLAGMMAGTGRVDEATTLLKQAINIPKVRDARTSRLLVHRDLGVILRAAGKNPEAAQQLRIVFEAAENGEPKLTNEEMTLLFGENGEAFEKLGTTFLDAELPDLAVRAFDRAAAADSSNPAVHSFNLASVYRKTGRPEQALEQLQKYLDAELQSKGRRAYDLLANLLEDLGRESELLPKLKGLVEVDRRNTALRYFYAEKLRDSGQAEQAEEQYRIALGGGRDLRGLIGLISLITAREALGEKDGSELFDLLQRTYPVVVQNGQGGEEFQSQWDKIKANEPLIDAVAAAARAKIASDEPTLEFFPAYVFGRLMIDAERSEDATAFYRYAMKLRSDPPINLYREIGEYLLEHNEYELAAEIYREALESSAERDSELRPVLLYQLSTALVKSGDTDSAYDAIREAQSIQPNNLAWQFWEGIIASEAKQFEEAEKIYREFIAKHKNSRSDENNLVQRAQFQLSNVYVQLDDLDRGAAVLLEILEEDPNETQANNDLGYLWADAGINLDRAEKMIRKAIEAEPENPAYQDSLGWVLYKVGKAEEGVPYLEKAAEHESGQDTVIYEHLGLAYKAVGRVDDARVALEKALEMETEKLIPDDETVKRIKDVLVELSGAE